LLYTPDQQSNSRTVPQRCIQKLAPIPLLELDQRNLEDACFIVYEDEREVIATYVSTCGLQRQSHKGKLNSNEVSIRMAESSY